MKAADAELFERIFQVKKGNNVSLVVMELEEKGIENIMKLLPENKRNLIFMSYRLSYKAFHLISERCRKIYLYKLNTGQKLTALEVVTKRNNSITHRLSCEYCGLGVSSDFVP
ncbi:hypothetical protein [Listeria goaensis]|uniref:hypothetical protein n=1 Tax=Listeria goaensis TaxID=1649188 RepID=UPI001966DE64|nr:hypothetical protein [Listeria goaensis]